MKQPLVPHLYNFFVSAKQIWLGFKARGANLMPLRIASDEQRRRRAKFALPFGRDKIRHFLCYSSSAYRRGYNLLVAPRKCLNFSSLAQRNYINEALVSVIIPSYNRQNSIAQSIESVLSQSYKNLEIIVIDNRSIDNTPKILAEYSKKDSRIKVVENEQNLSLVKTLNKAINISTGVYLARLDDDDTWLDTRKVEKQVNFLEAHQDYVLIGTGVIAVNEHGVEISRTLLPQEHHQIIDVMLFRCLFIHSAVVFRRNTFQALGGYNEALQVGGEDYDLWLRMGLVGKMYNVPEYLVQYQESGKKLSRTNRKKVLLRNILLIKKYGKDYPNFGKAMALSVLYYIYFSLPFNQKMLPLFSRVKRAIFGSVVKKFTSNI